MYYFNLAGSQFHLSTPVHSLVIHLLAPDGMIHVYSLSSHEYSYGYKVLGYRCSSPNTCCFRDSICDFRLTSISKFVRFIDDMISDGFHLVFVQQGD